MRRLITILAIFTLTSVAIFGISLEIGGGVEMLSFMGITVPLPTAMVGISVPVSGEFSITGQANVLFPMSSSEGASLAYMLLGGGRYTFSKMRPKFFVGADGGVMTDFQSSSKMIPIVGINGGIYFSMFYVKAAMRWMILTASSQATTGPTTLLLPLTELTAGMAFNF